MTDDKNFRQGLAKYLASGHAHVALSEAVAGLSEAQLNKKLRTFPSTIWQLLEHIRMAQWDMLDFIRNPEYEEMDWPDDYWPDPKQRATRKTINESLKAYDKDLEELREIVLDPKNDLTRPISHGQGQTILQEVLQVVDHASYHTGQILVMRRAMGAWKE